MAAAGSHCYQVMRAPPAQALLPWIDARRDLVGFEIAPVTSSADFWAEHRAG